MESGLPRSGYPGTRQPHNPHVPQRGFITWSAMPESLSTVVVRIGCNPYGVVLGNMGNGRRGPRTQGSRCAATAGL